MSSQTDHPVERIRPGAGLRSLRRGEVGNSLQSTPTALTRSSFRSLLRTEIERAASERHTLLLVRAAIRPFPGRRADLSGRELPEELLAASRLRTRSRRSPRWEAPELMLLVPSLATRADGERLLTELLHALTEPVAIDGLPHHLAPRLGGAFLDDDNATIELLQDGTQLALDETDPNQPAMFFHPFSGCEATCGETWPTTSGKRWSATRSP